MNQKNSNDYIRAIANFKSISLAAESLGISQPAISSYLKKVENQLGTVLFDRSKQPLELTDAGVVYLNYLDQMQGLQKQLMQSISDIEGLHAGHLTIGGASFFNVSYMPHTLAKFHAKYPGIEIEIVDSKVPELEKHAQKGNIDVFITPFNNENDKFAYEKLLTEKIYLAVPPTWSINDELRGDIMMKEGFEKLCENTFIVLKEDQHIGQIMTQLFNKYGCKPERIIKAEQTMTTLALTTNGVGVSLITETSLSNIHISRLPKLYIADREICTRDIYIAYPKNKYLSQATLTFIEMLKQEWNNK